MKLPKQGLHNNFFHAELITNSNFSFAHATTLKVTTSLTILRKKNIFRTKSIKC